MSKLTPSEISDIQLRLDTLAPGAVTGVLVLDTGERLPAEIRPDLTWSVQLDRSIRDTRALETRLQADFVVQSRYGDAKIGRPSISSRDFGIHNRYSGVCTSVAITRLDPRPSSWIIAELTLDDDSGNDNLSRLDGLALRIQQPDRKTSHQRDELVAHVLVHRDSNRVCLVCGSLLIGPEELDNLASALSYLIAWLWNIRLSHRRRLVWWNHENGFREEYRRLPRGERKNTERKFRPIPASIQDWFFAAKRCGAKKGSSHEFGSAVLNDGFFESAINALVQSKSLLYAVEYLLLAATTPVDATGALLSVALEALSSERGLGVEGFVVPADVWARVRADLSNALSSSAGLAERPDARDILTKKLDSLNRAPNQLKLVDVFAKMGLTLTKREEDAIGKRNAYLHAGGVLVRIADPDLDQVIGAHVVEAALASALNRLVLTRLGYRGPVFDWGAYGPEKWRPIDGELDFTFHWLGPPFDPPPPTADEEPRPVQGAGQQATRPDTA